MRRVPLSKAFPLLVALAALSACAGNGPQINARQEAARYAAMTPRDYNAPGPPWDPWGPYIGLASKRFDVPQRWIREVMRVESGGHEYLDGQPITSPAGAMGLMQVMPETYQELEYEYGLGSNPYNPRDNILAGTAYIREMYDLFGSPGFLAAYNAGPATYEAHLTYGTPLPWETQRYVAMIAPRIRGVSPGVGGEQFAMNSAPVPLPAAPVTRLPEVRVAELPEPPRPAAPPARPAMPQLPPPPLPRAGFHLIAPALADTLPPAPPNPSASPSGKWAIQVGAFGQINEAHVAISAALRAAPGPLRTAWPMVGSVREGNGMLYRARLVGLSRDAAMQACEQLGRAHNACFVISPAAQS